MDDRRGRRGWRPPLAPLLLVILLGAGCGSAQKVSAPATAPSATASTTQPPKPVGALDPSPAELHIAAKVKLPGLWSDVAVIADGSLWVATHGAGTFEIDPGTNKVVSLIDQWTDRFAVGAGSVWDCELMDQPPFFLQRRDIRSGKLLFSMPILGDDRTPLNYCAPVIFAKGSVWFFASDGKLRQIDPRTNATVSTIEVSDHADQPGLCYADGSLWATSLSGVVRVDPDRKETIATIEIKAYDRGCATDGHDLWAVGRGTITKIDTMANREAVTINVGMVSTYERVEVADGNVWVRTTANRLVLVDGETNTVIETYGLPDGEYPASVIVGFGSLWVLHWSLKEVWRVDVGA